MFKHLMNFGYQRNLKQAAGFYLAYLVLALLLASVSSYLIDMTDLTNAELLREMEVFQETKEMSPELRSYFEKMSTFSAIFASIFSAILAVLIAIKKNIFREVRILGAVIVIIIINYLAGPVLGLLPMAWLTMREDKSGASYEDDEESDDA